MTRIDAEPAHNRLPQRSCTEPSEQLSNSPSPPIRSSPSSSSPSAPALPSLSSSPAVRASLSQQIPDSALPQAPLEKPSRWEAAEAADPPMAGTPAGAAPASAGPDAESPSRTRMDEESPSITRNTSRTRTDTKPDGHGGPADHPGCDPGQAKANHPHRGAQAC